MWSFEVIANITSMFSLYCNSTKNRNNNITMILAPGSVLEKKLTGGLGLFFWV